MEFSAKTLRDLAQFTAKSQCLHSLLCRKSDSRARAADLIKIKRSEQFRPSDELTVFSPPGGFPATVTESLTFDNADRHFCRA